MVYIYGLVCPVAQTVRYVGKSVNPRARLRSHMMAARREDYDHHTSRWLRRLIAAGLAPDLIILHEVRADERWQDVERRLIADAQSQGWRLTNSTAGGEGLDFIDPAAEAKYRANLSASMKELWNRPERRVEARERVLRMHADPEVSARRAEAMRAAYQDPALRAQASRIAKEVQSRPEVKRKHAAKAAAQWASPDGRAMMMAARDEDARAKMSAAAKARYADPIKGAVAREQASSPEKRAKLAAAAQRRATPEYRAMMAEKTRASWEKRRSNKG